MKCKVAECKMVDYIIFLLRQRIIYSQPKHQACTVHHPLLKRLIRDKSHCPADLHHPATPIRTKVPPALFTQTCPTIHLPTTYLQQLNGPMFADGGKATQTGNSTTTNEWNGEES